jgi:hypothetical protein
LFFLLFASSGPADLAAHQNLRLIALTGDEAPGGNAGEVYGSLGIPSLNDEGLVAFSADLLGTSNNSGVWIGNGTTPPLPVALAGDAAPGITVEATFLSFGPPNINENGQVAFLATLTGSSINVNNNRGLWSNGGENGLELVARRGDIAPETDGDTFSIFGSLEPFPILNNRGQVAFNSQLFTSGDLVIYRQTASGRLSLAARENDLVPGREDTTVIETLGRVRLSDNSVTTFLGGGDVFDPLETSFTAMFTKSENEELNWLVGRRDAIPTSDGALGGLQSFISHATINGSGETIVAAILFGRIDNRIPFAVIRGSKAGEPTIVARTSDQAPFADDGVFIAGGGAPAINGKGNYVFTTSLYGSGITNDNNSALLLGSDDDEFKLLWREGELAPRINESATFDSMEGTSVTLNSKDQIAFMGNLRGAGIDSANERGIWARDRTGDLVPVARHGDRIDVSSDPFSPDSRTVVNLSFFGGTGNEDGVASSFNNEGQLAFLAEFSDGSSAIFVSDVAALPEPTTFGLLLLGFVIGTSRRQGLRSISCRLPQ